MDRLNRKVVAGVRGTFCLTLGVALAASGVGCRSLRPEVPPHKPFIAGADPTQQTPAIGFSSTPATPTMNGLPSSAAGQVGAPSTGTQGGSLFGAPTGNAFGQPGTSGLGTTPSVGAATGTGLPPASPPSEGMNVPGTPGQFPSPN